MVPIPIMGNDLILDIFLLSFESTEDIRCYLCNCKLSQPKSVVGEYPPEYRICCVCKNMLRQFAIKNFTYNDMVKIVEKTIDKILLSQGRLKRKNFSKYEWQCVRLFIEQSLMEKDIVLDKLRLFFFKVGDISK